MLKQLKKKHVKQELAEIDRESIELSPTLATLVERVGGKRPANLWLQYNSALRPDTREQWQKHHFVHKTHIGFYRLPQPFLVYAPEEQQPSLDCTIEEMMPVSAALDVVCLTLSLPLKSIFIIEICLNIADDEYSCHTSQCEPIASIFIILLP